MHSIISKLAVRHNLLRFASLFCKPRGALRILMYHHISAINFQSFQKQMEFIHNRYHVISPQEFCKAFSSSNSKKISILISFDDGFKSVKNAVSYLSKTYGSYCALFIVPAYSILSDRDAQIKFAMRKFFLSRTETAELFPLGLDDLRDLVASGHLIASHTWSHQRLSQIKDASELEREIKYSKEMLEEALSTKINWFAVPYGKTKDVSIQAFELIKNNYEMCFWGIRGNNIGRNRYLLLRDNIKPEWSLDFLQFIIEGGLDLYYQIREVKKLDYLFSMRNSF